MRAVVIVFLGIHGSGKTTQGQLLCQALRKQGLRAEYVHQLAGQGGPERWAERLAVQPLLAGLKRLLAGEPGLRPDEGHQLDSQILRRAAATGAAARGVWQTWLRLVRSEAAVLIFDRYAYDSLIRARWWYGVSPVCETLFLRLVPLPDALIYLEADPQQAWRRHKGQEWSLEQMVWQKQVYQDWLKLLQAERPDLNLHIIPCRSSIEAAHRRAAEAVYPILEFKVGFQPPQTLSP